jgi:hypothetical protein
MAMKNNPTLATKPLVFELNNLLEPALVFARPRDVVDDPELTLDEKRAILASWASDACAVEAAPALRRAPGAKRPVDIDEILEALQLLDRHSRGDLRNSIATHRPGFGAPRASAHKLQV